jgi:hypothetical protein
MRKGSQIDILGLSFVTRSCRCPGTMLLGALISFWNLPRYLPSFIITHHPLRRTVATTSWSRSISASSVTCLAWAFSASCTEVAGRPTEPKKRTADVQRAVSFSWFCILAARSSSIAVRDAVADIAFGGRKATDAVFATTSPIHTWRAWCTCTLR